RVEALHLVAPTVTRREHQHGHGPTGPAPSFENRDPVHLRQADIQDDSVVGLALTEIVPLFTVIGAIHDIAGIGQRRRKLTVQTGIVLPHEKTQSLTSCPRFRSSPSRQTSDTSFRRKTRAIVVKWHRHSRNSRAT